MGSTRSVVVPAKAGTHFTAGHTIEPWIPAFAGMTFPEMLQRFFVEQAGGDPVRRQLGVMAERTTGAETVAFVKADRLCLQCPRFQPQHRLAGFACFPLDVGEQRLADAAAAGRLAGVHAL